MTSESFNREYICRTCFLVYRGYFDAGGVEGREPCPYCGADEPEATDTFSSAYWERDLAEVFGVDAARRLYWTLPARQPDGDADWTKRHQPHPQYRAFHAALAAFYTTRLNVGAGREAE